MSKDTLKKCCTCKTYFPVATFANNRSQKDGKNSQCRSCTSAHRKASYLKHRPERREYYKKYYEMNKEKTRAVHDAYRKTDAGKYKMAKGAASYRKIEWTLSESKFHELSKAPCHYCGQAKETTTMAGIDRVDSSLGYTLENSVSCCRRCNSIFNTYQKEEQFSHMLLMLKVAKKV